MSKFIIILSLVTSITSGVTAQSTFSQTGARTMGLGRTSSCLSDEWSTFNNVGGLAKVEKVTAAFAQEIYSSIRSFNRTAATCAVPLSYGVTGVSLFRFGDDLYNEQIISLGFANTFGITSIGLKLNYIQYRADGFGRKGLLSVGAGGITQLSKKVLVGIYITNINQPKISENDKEYLPTIVTAGLAVNASENVFITTEVEVDLGYDPIWKTGMEYSFNKKFLARTGFNLNPDAFFAGCGFVSSRLKLDYAFQYNATLGNSHQASVAYLLKRQRKRR